MSEPHWMDVDLSGLIRSDIDAANFPIFGPSGNRPRRYVGGPPPKRLYRLELAHELRARKAGIPWDMVDFRTVYRNHGGKCGICHGPVDFESFTIDHIVPISKGGPHLLHNLQPAHHRCNSRKGDR